MFIHQSIIHLIISLTLTLLQCSFNTLLRVYIIHTLSVNLTLGILLYIQYIYIYIIEAENIWNTQKYKWTTCNPKKCWVSSSLFQIGKNPTGGLNSSNMDKYLVYIPYLVFMVCIYISYLDKYHIWYLYKYGGFVHIWPKHELKQSSIFYNANIPKWSFTRNDWQMSLTMTIPPDCSAVHMLIMGAMPMVVPWK